jgi:parallel beta-helix repeat protein
MKTKYWLSSLVVGVGLALTLLWGLGGGNMPAVAAPPASSDLSAAEGSIEAPDVPAAELRVCATCTYTTVQSAVDAANDGDVIKVATGVYTGVQARDGVMQLVYVSKTVIVRGGYITTNWDISNPDANPTILDARAEGRVFFITADISPTIEGLRITGGDATGLYGGPGGWDAGGGLYVANATAVISDNWVFSNTAYGGGGLYLSDSAAMLSGNVIASNTVNDEGGGLFLFDSDATLSHNIITSNTASDHGGGLYLHYSDATLDTNTIDFNAAREGGGLYLRDSDAALSENIIGSNTASDDGGGLFLDLGSEATLDQNTIVSNTAYSGGGLFLWGSNPTLHGNVVVANNAQLGGGLFVRESDAGLDNNVVAKNRAANQGSGLYVAGSVLRLRHTTVAQNDDGDGTGIYVTDYGPYYSTVALTNTILVSHTVGVFVAADNVASLEATLWGDGAWANTDDWSGDGTILIGTINVYGAPAFAGADDYHILTDSAAKDAGVDAGVTPDMDLDLRPVEAGYDIGADEFPVVVTTSQGTSTTLVYVDPRGNPTRLRLPEDAVTGTVVIVYTPKDPRVALPPPEGMAVGPHVFDLDAYRNDVLIPDFFFERAVTLTSEYSSIDMLGIEENSLALYRKTEGEWKIIGTQAGETQTLDIENNLLTAYLVGTSQFAEMGPAAALRFVFLPLVSRNWSPGTAGLPRVTPTPCSDTVTFARSGACD